MRGHCEWGLRLRGCALVKETNWLWILENDHLGGVWLGGCFLVRKIYSPNVSSGGQSSCFVWLLRNGDCNDGGSLACPSVVKVNLTFQLWRRIKGTECNTRFGLQNRWGGRTVWTKRTEQISLKPFLFSNYEMRRAWESAILLVHTETQCKKERKDWERKKIDRHHHSTQHSNL